MTDAKKKEIIRDFKRTVNMSPATLEKWLETEESRAVGFKPPELDGDSVGHRSGERILEIKATKQADLTLADYRHMRKVVGYVHRHLAQRPGGDVSMTRWRYSLMNWGHDPLKSQATFPA